MKNCIYTYFSIVLLLLWIPQELQAQNRKYVIPNGTGTKDGSSWANASGDLQAMIRTNPSEIWMANGTYKPTVKPTGAGGNDNRDKCFYIKNSILTIYGGFNGTESSPSERAPGLGTILSGDIGTPGNKADNCYHVVLADSSFLLNLNQIQISDGNANGLGSLTMNGYSIPRDFGGGLHLRPASGLVSYIVLGFSAFVSNSATKGSAIYDGRNEAASFSPYFNYAYNTLFLDNEAPEGGASWYFNLQSRQIINFSTFSNNKGGALYFGESLFPTLTNQTRIYNCVFSPGATSTDDVVINSPAVTYKIQNCIYGIGNMPSGNGNFESNDFQFINPSNPRGPDNVLGTSDDGLRHHPDFEGINLGAAAAIPDSAKRDIAGNPRSFGTSDAGAYERDTVEFHRWYVKPGATGKGTSWAEASGNLNHIIDTASGKSRDEIWVAQGTYKPTQSPVLGDNDSRNFSFKLRSGVAMFGGFTGIETNLAQRPKGQKSILDGDIGNPGNKSDNCYHVVISINDSVSTILDGFQIENGNANGSENILVEGVRFNMNQGAGIYLSGSYTTIQNLNIRFCEAGFGGGIFLNDSPLKPSNLVFEQNKAATDGGAVFVNTSLVTFTKCSFLNNQASGNGGALVLANSPQGIHLLKCAFSLSSASRGGAIYNFQSRLIIRNSVFERNSASIEGGAISNVNSPLDISNGTFYKNSANQGGAGLGKGQSIISAGLAGKINGSIFWGGNNQLQKTDGSLLSGVTYSTMENTVVPGVGNNILSPTFVDGNDSDGPDNEFGTFDDGLRLVGSNGINECPPDSNYAATDISDYKRCGIFDRGAYEAFAGKIVFSNQSNIPVSENASEPENLGTGQPVSQRFLIKSNGSQKDPLTIQDIRPSGLDSSSFQILKTYLPEGSAGPWINEALTFPFVLTGGEVHIQVTFTRNSPGNKRTSILVRSSNCDGISSAKFDVIAYDKPVIGNYSQTSVQTGAQVLIVPTAAPSYQTRFSATISPNFKGTLVADPVTGIVKISNAQPAGTYSVKVTASNPGYDSTKTFTLTVTKPSCSTGQFVNSGNFGEGNTITEAVLGDFNGDGKQDIASALFVSGTGYVSVRTGDGNGGLGLPLLSETGSRPKTLVTADFNLDGILDVASAGESNFVSIRLGVGNGFFSGTKEIATTNPQRMATGDFNGDGFADLVVTNGIQNRVQILLGDGKGDFSEAGFAGVGLSPNDLVVSDFNNDGKADLAVSLGFGSGTTLLLGNGLGQFPTRTDVTNTAEANSISVFDFNNDGKMDWVNTNFFNNSLTVHLGNGFGGSMANFEIPVSGNAYHAIAGDFNGDGFGDIATLSFVDNSIEILTGDGTGNFTPTSPLLSVPFNSSRLATGDFNGDGVTDLINSSISSTVFTGKKRILTVFGNQIRIENGDETPSVLDHTELGSALVNQNISKLFTLKNSGTDAITIDQLAFRGNSDQLESFQLPSISLPIVIQTDSSFTFSITFNSSVTGQKFAFVDIKQNFCNETFTFKISGTAVGLPVAQPVISPGNGTYSTLQDVSITCSTPGATIYYTTNGNLPRFDIPNSFTKVYTAPFKVANNTTIYAQAVKVNMVNSTFGIARLTFSVPAQVSSVVFTPTPGNYGSSQNISMTATPSDAQIYYTTNGNNPRVDVFNWFTKLYSTPVNISSNTSFRAIGMKSGLLNGPLSVGSYTIGSNLRSSKDWSYEIEVYPNPSSGKYLVNLLQAENENAAVRVFDVMGKTLYEKVFHGNETYEMDLTKLPNGFYFLEANVLGNKQVKRIVKE